MAASRAVSGSLSSNAAITVKFPQYFSNITVVNRSADQELWVRSDGPLATVAGDDCYPVLAKQSQVFGNGVLSQEPVIRITAGTQVSLISSGTCTYTVYAS